MELVSPFQPQPKQHLTVEDNAMTNCRLSIPLTTHFYFINRDKHLLMIGRVVAALCNFQTWGWLERGVSEKRA